MSDVTRVLSAPEQGDSHAAEELLPLVYDELRKLAAARRAQEDPGLTPQATALVHEVYLRLVDSDRAQPWDSRGHFSAAAAEAMRFGAGNPHRLVEAPCLVPLQRFQIHGRPADVGKIDLREGDRNGIAF